MDNGSGARASSAALTTCRRHNSPIRQSSSQLHPLRKRRNSVYSPTKCQPMIYLVYCTANARYAGALSATNTLSAPDLRTLQLEACVSATSLPSRPGRSLTKLMCAGHFCDISRLLHFFTISTSCPHHVEHSVKCTTFGGSTFWGDSFPPA